MAALASLAVAEAGDHSSGVDVLDAEMNGFRDTQAPGLHDDGAHASGGPADGGQELPNLLPAEDHGELLVAPEADEREDRQPPTEGLPEEELDGEEINAYGAVGAALRLGQTHEKLSNVVFGELVGASVEVLCEVLDGLQAPSLRAFGRGFRQGACLGSFGGAVWSWWFPSRGDGDSSRGSLLEGE